MQKRDQKWELKNRSRRIGERMAKMKNDRIIVLISCLVMAFAPLGRTQQADSPKKEPAAANQKPPRAKSRTEQRRNAAPVGV